MEFGIGAEDQSIQKHPDQKAKFVTQGSTFNLIKNKLDGREGQMRAMQERSGELACLYLCGGLGSVRKDRV